MRYMCPVCKKWVSDEQFICKNCGFGSKAIERQYFLERQVAKDSKKRYQAVFKLDFGSKLFLFFAIVGVLSIAVLDDDFKSGELSILYNQVVGGHGVDGVKAQGEGFSKLFMWLAIFVWILVCLFILYAGMYFLTDKGQWWRVEVKPRLKRWKGLHDAIVERKEALEIEFTYAKSAKVRLQKVWFDAQSYPSVEELREFYGIGDGLVSLLLQNGIYDLSHIYSYEQLESLNGIGSRKAELLVKGRTAILARWQAQLKQEYEYDIYPNQHKPKIIKYEQAAVLILERLERFKLTVDLAKVRKMIRKSHFLYWFIFSPDPKMWEELTQDLKVGWNLLQIHTSSQHTSEQGPERSVQELPQQAQPDQTAQNSALPQPIPPSDLEPPPQREQTTVWRRAPSVRNDPFSKLVKKCGSEEKAWIHILQTYYEPSEFERFVGAIWSALGYQVQVTKSSGDQGVDVIAERGPVRVAIECKRYKGSVTPDVVRGIAAHLSHKRNPATEVVIVTTGKFTKQSEKDAKDFGVILIGPKELAQLIRDSNVKPDISKLG